MNPLRRKRLLIILAILVGVGIAVTLALSALQQNINLFYTPTQIANGEAPVDTRIRAGGMVEQGSLKAFRRFVGRDLRGHRFQQGRDHHLSRHSPGPVSAKARALSPWASSTPTAW